MNHQLQSHCLSSVDLAAYMAGTIQDKKRRRIEQHLTDCDCCFDDFVDFFNQELNHTLAHSQLEFERH